MMTFANGMTALFELPLPEDAKTTPYEIGPADRDTGVVVPRHRWLRWLGSDVKIIPARKILVATSNGNFWHITMRRMSDAS